MARLWLFGNAEFDERRRELSVAGEPVKLDRKDLGVLQELLLHAGEVVTKQEFLDAVWPGLLVTENSLTQCIKNIRDALGDDDRQIIRTEHGYGYKLAVPVRIEAARALAVPARLGLKRGDHPPLRPQWALVEQLGGGGQGEVWLGRHERLGEQRVFKFALDEGCLAAIKREIAIYGLLRKVLGEREDIARVLDWNVEEAPYFIELEYAAAGNLEAWVHARGGLKSIPQPERLEIVAKISDALAAAHSVGVLHKDLKPSNVLISGSGTAVGIKLTDFGSGSVLDPARLQAMGLTIADVAQSMARRDMPATFMYLAPEVAAGQPATVQADVYSLGVLLYQAVIGDFRHPLPPDWQQHVGDPLLCEDISAAVGFDGPRLRDASELAKRLRSLDERWRQREAARQEKERLEREQRAANERARLAEFTVVRLRTRRNWMLTALSTLIVGFALSLGLYFEARRARNEAAAEAASSRAVADFLSKDMFAVVGSRPLRDLTVQELLEAAAKTLANRAEIMPAPAAQIHAALGNAFWTMENIEQAEDELRQALELYTQLEGSASVPVITIAAQHIFAKGMLARLPDDLGAYEQLLTEGRRVHGPLHPAVLLLQNNLAHAHYDQGHYRRSADEFQALIETVKTAPQPEPHLIAGAEMMLGNMLIRLGDFKNAEKVLHDSLSRSTPSAASLDVTLAKSRLFLAIALMEQERFREAERELARAVTLMRTWSVDDSSAHLIAMRGIEGALRARQGKAGEAIPLLKEAIAAVAAQSWNARRDRTAEFRTYLAAAYLQAGRLAEAEAAARQAVEISQLADGASHPWTVATLIGLAEILRVRGKADEATSVLMSVDRRALEALGTSHPLRGEFLRVEGLLALAAHRSGHAQRVLQSALEIVETCYGKQHTFTARLRSELAGATARATREGDRS